jgi:hypothetical protein
MIMHMDLENNIIPKDVLNIREILLIMNIMDMDYIFLRMKNIMKDFSKIVWQMVKEHIIILMEIYMKESFLII